MMPVTFDSAGHASVAGEIRVYHYVKETGEYRGWSDEFIPVGVSLPGCSTAIEVGADTEGYAWVFDGKAWHSQKDHRGEMVYSTDTLESQKVDYLGSIRDGFTGNPPSSQYDKWDGEKWVTDTDAAIAADIEIAEQQKQELIAAAQRSISLLQTKLLMGRTLTDAETNKVNKTLDYIDAVEATPTSTAPDITFPQLEA